MQPYLLFLIAEFRGLFTFRFVTCLKKQAFTTRIPAYFRTTDLALSLLPF